MKWVLVALVMNSPIKTDLVFSSLEECMAEVGIMTLTWSKLIQREAEKNDKMTIPDHTKKYLAEALGKKRPDGTCIPSK
jgi:hypothetical protein